MKTKVMSSGNQTFKKDCVLYYRVSRDEQETMRQKMECEEYIKEYGFNVVTEPFEEKISGRKEDREVMNECLKYIKENDIHYLIMAEISRLSRSLEGSEIIRQLSRDKVCVIGIRDKIQTLDEDFKEDREMTAKASQAITDAIKESNQLSYRVKKGKRAKILYQGNWYGGNRYPYGYKYSNKKLELNIQESEIVKDIFNKYLSGWGSIKISNYLNTNNIQTRFNKGWTRSSISQLLSCKLYIGKRRYEDNEFDVPELRIIDDILFYQVQSRMKDRKNVDKTFNQLVKYDYPLNGLLKCGNCGKSYRGIHRDNSYKCTSGRYSHGCGNSSVNMDWLNTRIQDYILDNMKQLIFDNSLITKQTDEMITEIKLLEKNKTDQQELLIRINDMYLRNRISLMDYDSKYKTTDEQLKRINNKLQELNTKIIENKNIMNIQRSETFMGISRINDVKEHWNINDDNIRNVIKTITIFNKMEGKQRIKVQLINGNEFELMK